MAVHKPCKSLFRVCRCITTNRFRIFAVVGYALNITSSNKLLSIPCALCLFAISLARAMLLHLQDLLLHPPTAAMVVHQTSPHLYSFLSATLWLQTSGEQQSLHCQPECYPGYEVSVAAQCFSILQQLVWAPAVLQKGHYLDLEWRHWINLYQVDT